MREHCSGAPGEQPRGPVHAVSTRVASARSLQGGQTTCPAPHPARPPDRRPGDVAVRLRGIGKRFPGVVANDDINIDVRRGTIHAIVGENGAGKSTLMKILYGVQPPDSGTIEINGTEVVPSARPPTRSRPASAWSSSTSCWPTT